MFTHVPHFSTYIRDMKECFHTTGFCSQQDGLPETRQGIVSKRIFDGGSSVLLLVLLVTVVKETMFFFLIICKSLKWRPLRLGRSCEVISEFPTRIVLIGGIKLAKFSGSRSCHLCQKEEVEVKINISTTLYL